MKAIILCGGIGTRLKPLTYSIPKQLIPIANKPVLFYAIEKIINCGISEVCIVVNPWNQQVFKDSMKNFRGKDVQFDFVVQNEMKGIAHALSFTEDWTNGEDFLLYLGDNLLLEDINSFTEGFDNSLFDASLVLKYVEEPKRFGVAEVEENRIVRVVEKPQNPMTNLAIAGIYIFSNIIFDIIRKLKPSLRGEYEITDAIQGLIDSGKKISFTILDGWWKDTGKIEDLLEANELFLSNIKSNEINYDFKNTKISGINAFGENCEISDSVIIGPCALGKNVVVKNSVVGPYCSIGENCSLDNCTIQNSLIMEDVIIKDFPAVIEKSVLGKSSIFDFSSKPAKMRLMTGEANEMRVL